MKNHTIRVILYSSVAIALLALVWGFRQIPQQGRLADQALRESLDQELIVLTSAVRASNQALKFRLLDVLKAEGNDHVTRAFQDSPFQAATLLEWDDTQWKPLWYSTKSKTDLQSAELKNWMKDWPLSKLSLEDVYFAKVADLQGQAYFAVMVPVRRPSQVPMVGVGIFPANQFGLSFSADENREIRIFTEQGLALALTHPAYLGASLKVEPIVHEILESDEVSVRHEWKTDGGERRIGLAARVAESNLYAAIEAKPKTASTLQTWAYLVLCALGAGALNWVLFASLIRPLLTQLSQTEENAEGLRRQMTKSRAEDEEDEDENLIPHARLKDLDFREKAAPATAPLIGKAAAAASVLVPPATVSPAEPALVTSNSVLKIVQAALRTLDAKIKELGVNVMHFDLENLRVETDALQLQTAVEEIVKNALEAMASGPTRNLTITGSRTGGRNRIGIEDTGCGIPDADLDKVFDPFFSTKDSQGVARGLGLNVVRRVVEEMSGRVRLYSPRAGRTVGTRVDIEWPLGQESLAEEAVVFNLDDESGDLDELARLAEGPGRAAPGKLAAAAAAAAQKHWPEIAIRKPKVRTLD